MAANRRQDEPPNLISDHLSFRTGRTHLHLDLTHTTPASATLSAPLTDIVALLDLEGCWSSLAVRSGVWLRPDAVRPDAGRSLDAPGKGSALDAVSLSSSSRISRRRARNWRTALCILVAAESSSSNYARLRLHLRLRSPADK